MSSTPRNRPLALVGPTACGKTEASIPLARALGAEIVSIDSMVVYRGMDVGTAKPTPAERAAVPHHLLDVVDPAEPFSVAEFGRLAVCAIDDVRAGGALPLLVGGSGLYFRAVVDGLRFPATEPETRGLLEAEASALGPDAMYRRLAELDPVAAGRIEPSNVRRTVRALEVAGVTGRAFSTFAADWERYPAEHVRAAGIEVPRAVLHERIERRVSAMMPGLLAETARLVETGSGPRRFITSTQAIGYAEALGCLEGRLSVEEAAARTTRRTKALARRQLAWFRRDPRIRWFPVGQVGAIGALDGLIRYLGEEREGS
ncbi:MAG TPA: tRNA (adenosine(37)-N6)-dimethylallyltransferase MiaA [Actinomycetota bacterium]|nr:tRNA (adenosine(37)-N6)-dimethylallyltransferase MiaA [Actinomycetota bacterium]